MLRSPTATLLDSVCNVYKTNVVAVERCEPDENGMINLGSFGNFLTASMLQGKHVTKCIAVINKNLQPVRSPRMDLVSVPVTKFDAFCRNDHPWSP